MTSIDLIASEGHYLDHLRPVWRALPERLQGSVFTGPGLPGEHINESLRSDDLRPALIAGAGDLSYTGGRKVVMMEHGCGQSYHGDPESAGNPAYAGGQGRHNVMAFLCPNEQSAQRNREVAAEGVVVEVIGSPRLQELQGIPAAPKAKRITVAFGWHTDLTLVAEASSAWRHYVEGLRGLAESGEFEILGHAHPRAWSETAPTYVEMGIEPVQDFTEVLARAHVYCADNTSTLFEFAALREGRVVVLDAPWYRRDVEHGLRFWDCADVGIRIGDPAAMATAIRATAGLPLSEKVEGILDRVFPPVEDPAQYAAQVIARVLGEDIEVRPRGVATFPKVAPRA